MPAVRILGLGLLLIMIWLQAACGTGREDEIEQPEYATASYATIRDARDTTLLRFEDVAAATGIDFRHETGAFGAKWMPETMGSGGGFLDYDMDGLPDLFLVNGSEWPGHSSGNPPATQRLYRNLGDGTFADVTVAAGLDLTIYGMGSAFADYDADGDPDIYITAVGDNKLLRNDRGFFVDVTSDAGVSGSDVTGSAPPAWSTAAAWVDVDRDGWLDLFVCNYVQWTPDTDLFTTLDGKNKSYATPQQYRGETCRLYRNTGSGRFRDVTARAGVFNPSGKSLGMAVTDINRDGWPDIVVANDTEPNFLYLNDGDGTFTDIGLRAGMGFDEFGRARAGMGVDVGDVTGDGNLSIVIGNFSREPLSLFQQIDTELFQDVAGRARLTRESLLKLTFGVLFVDLDLDGHIDLMTANGHIEPEINAVQQEITFAQTPQIFLNNGSGEFTEVSKLVGAALDRTVVARGLAHADIDRDGDSDMLITINGGTPMLLRTDFIGPRRNSIGITLRGLAPNLDAIGAAVTLYVGGRAQHRMVRTGSSYLTQSDAGTLLFGLGDATQADSVVVRWPTTGTETRFGALEAGQRYLVTEQGSARDPLVIQRWLSDRGRGNSADPLED